MSNCYERTFPRRTFLTTRSAALQKRQNFPSIPKSWQKSIILRALDLAAGRFKPDRASCMLEPSGVDRRARGRAGSESREPSPNCPRLSRPRDPAPPAARPRDHARVVHARPRFRPARAPARPVRPAPPAPPPLRWFRHLSGAVRFRRGPLVVQWPAVSATFNLTGGNP